jgi:hypothetical protein
MNVKEITADLNVSKNRLMTMSLLMAAPPARKQSTQGSRSRSSEATDATQPSSSICSFAARAMLLGDY